jgi:Fe-S cluster assembly ATPase SufC
VFVGGRIVEEGGPELAERLENEGYEKFSALAQGDDPLEPPRTIGKVPA